jgi:lipoate-protein ligase B
MLAFTSAFRQRADQGTWRLGRRCKIASIGIQIRRWIAFHGVALNVSTDLAFFADFPCRMPEIRMTSLRKTESGVSMPEARATTHRVVPKTLRFAVDGTELGATA